MRHKTSVMNSITGHQELHNTFKKALALPFGSTKRDNARKIFNSMSLSAQNKFKENPDGRNGWDVLWTRRPRG